MTLHRFHGGLKLAAHKSVSTASSCAACVLPTELVLPVNQHAGDAAECVVQVGQYVRRGELIARAVGERSAAVHASSSGTVIAIEMRATPQASAETALCVVIATDGRDETQTLTPIENWRDVSREILLERIAAAGIVGLGGAAFPSAMKLSVTRDTLILNGAECEPYISCDEVLMRERAAEVIAGTQLLAHICKAERVVLAVEDRMREAHAALAAAIQDAAIELICVPTIYPAGGERQLIRVITGHEVPSGGLPRDIGVICHNVATAVAAWRAVVHGEALTERIVTITGRGVKKPGNFRVRLGTPIAHLVEQAGGYTPQAARLVMGGPMMGVALPNDATPIMKATNCVLVLADKDVQPTAPELPCIRCGECAEACPAQLLPQTLLTQLRDGAFGAADQQGLFDCIECGACAFVCPSQIPLVDWYRFGKSELRLRQDQLARADLARARYHARNERLARNAAERVARVAARGEEPASQAATAPENAEPVTPQPANTSAMDKAAVLAAIARGKAKRQTPPT